MMVFGSSLPSSTKQGTGQYSCAGKEFLAHRIRISEILPWNRKCYLTHAILPRLSREGFIHWLYWNSRTWSSSDVIVMFK